MGGRRGELGRELMELSMVKGIEGFWQGGKASAGNRGNRLKLNAQITFGSI